MLISQLTLNLQGSVPACARETTLNLFILEQVVAKKDILSDTFERPYEHFVNAFVSRERRLLT